MDRIKTEHKSRMGLSAATAIGVGGMIGAGIFSVMGVAAETAGSFAYLAFALAGVVALGCAHSFGKLGARYPTAGGPVEFLTQGLGWNHWTGGINLLLWIGYVIANALYARTFGEYAAELLALPAKEIWVPVLATAVVLIFLMVNRMGADSVGTSELILVVIKVLILVVFSGAGVFAARELELLPKSGSSISPILFAAGIVFMAYEGFGLITNAADDMSKVRVNLPRALYASVVIVIIIYVAAAIAVTGSLTPSEISRESEYALAAAAKPIFGQAGFVIISLAALVSTASAINATLYGGANVSYMLARKGGLPYHFDRHLWQTARGGLLITSFAVIIFAILLPIEQIAMMGSLAFLVVYGAVNLAHLNLLKETGGNRWIVLAALAGCAIGTILLGYYVFTVSPWLIALFVGLCLISIGMESVYSRERAHDPDEPK